LAHEPTLREEIGALLRLSWPITVAQVGLMTMGLVDTAILGRVSVVELSGGAIGRAVMFAAVTPAMGVALALEPLASQAVGAKEEPRAWASLVAMSRAVVAVSLPCLFLGVLSLYGLEGFGVPAPDAARARAFALAELPGSLFWVLFLGHKTFLQAHGRTRPILVASLVANVVNLVVCNLLVRGDGALTAFGLHPLGLPAMGAFGAGLAFSVASFLMWAIGARASGRFRPVTPALPTDERFVSARAVARLGTPVGLQLLAEVGVFAVATVLVGRFGSASVSAHQIVIGLSSLTFMGALGISAGTAVRVGYAVGEERSPRRAGLVGLTSGAAVMSVGGVAFALFPTPLVRLFTQDAEVVALGAPLLLIAAFFQLFDGLQAVGGGALRGAGDVRFPFLATVAAHWGVGFPLAVLFGFVAKKGLQGIWWGLAMGLVTISGLLVARFLYVCRGKIARV
jgi:MATE family multidrug resistance protein